jgi:hypothetical protein
MPPKKRGASTIKIGLGYLELELLKALVDATGGSFASHVRRAIRYYAQKALTTGGNALVQKLHTAITKSVRDPQERRMALADLQRFLEHEVVAPRPTNDATDDDLADIDGVDGDKDFES